MVAAAFRAALPAGPPPECATTRALLRQATQKSHEALHRHAGLAALAGGVLALDGYCQLLLELLPLHALMDRRLCAFDEEPCFAWANSPSRIPASHRLCADLRALGLPLGPVTDLDALLPPFEAPAEAMGCAWVIEGSALGARILSGALANSLGIGPHNGGAFFALQPDQKPRWLACCATIEEMGQATINRALMVAGAQATFDTFLKWLNRIS